MNENVPTYPYTIDRASVYMHTTPELSGEMCDELPYGTRLRVLSEAASDSGIAWVRCETAYGYCGYLPEKVLAPAPFCDAVPHEKLYAFAVTAPFCDVLLDSLYKYRPILTLPRAAVVLARRPTLSSDRFFPILHKGRRFFVPTAALRPLLTEQKGRNAKDVSSSSGCPENPNSVQLKSRTGLPENTISALRKQICDDALSYLGTPYRWGGRTPSGIDCSGLCFTVYALNGLPLWRDAYADKRYVHEIDKTQLQPGYLIYFKSHMALYIGDDEYVHASASTGYVTVGSLNPASVLWRQDLAQSFLCFAESNFL